MVLQIILASASPRRSELLRQMGYSFEVMPSQAEELHHEQLTARELCLLNAHRKARSVAKRFPDALVIGADTLVYLGTKLFGKPESQAEAERMLAQLAGQTHQVVTGVCLLSQREHRESLFAEVTQVTFKPLSKAVIRRYLGAVQVLDKAGAYGIQERGDMLVDRVEGSLSNVIGLPVERLKRELDKFLHKAQQVRARGRRSRKA